MDLNQKIDDASRELAAARDREDRAKRRLSISRIAGVCWTLLGAAALGVALVIPQIRTAWVVSIVCGVAGLVAWARCCHRRTLRVRATRVREEAEAKQLAAINRARQMEELRNNPGPRDDDVTVTEEAPPTRDSGVMAAASPPDFTQEAHSGAYSAVGGLNRPFPHLSFGKDAEPQRVLVMGEERLESRPFTAAEPIDRFPAFASIAALLAEARAWSPEDRRQRNRANYWADRRYDFEQRYAGREEFKAVLESQRVPTMTGFEARRIAAAIALYPSEPEEIRLLTNTGEADASSEAEQVRVVAVGAMAKMADHAHHGAAMMARSIEILTIQRDELLGNQLGQAMQAIAVQQAGHRLEQLGDHIEHLLELGNKLRDPAERERMLLAVASLKADVEGLRIVEGEVEGSEDA